MPLFTKKTFDLFPNKFQQFVIEAIYDSFDKHENLRVGALFQPLSIEFRGDLFLLDKFASDLKNTSTRNRTCCYSRFGVLVV